MDILIAGGGPAGLMTALALARRGIRSTVLEARSAPTDIGESRAITWMPRAIEVAEASGFREDLERVALHRYVHSFTDKRGRLLAVVHFDHLDSPFPYTLQIPQGESERILERVALGTGLVDLRRGFSIEAIDSGSVGVSATGRHGGDTVTVHGDLGVAADGARSVVRAQLGIPTTKRDYGASSVVADFIGTSGLPPTQSQIVLDTRRPRGLFPIGEGRWRLVYRVNGGEDRGRAASPDQASRILDSFPGARAAEWTWTSAFRLAQQKASTYLQGAWVLVGDAAHPMGPSAGAGMMLGVLGAWRAAWAISRVQEDAGSLSAYVDEQRASAVRVQSSNATIFRHIALRNGVLGAVRAGAMPVAARLTSLEAAMARQESLVDEPLPDLPPAAT